MLSFLLQSIKSLFYSNNNRVAETRDRDIEEIEKEYVIHPYLLDNLDTESIQKLLEDKKEPTETETDNSLEPAETKPEIDNLTETETDNSLEPAETKPEIDNPTEPLLLKKNIEIPEKMKIYPIRNIKKKNTKKKTNKKRKNTKDTRLKKKKAKIEKRKQRRYNLRSKK